MKCGKTFEEFEALNGISVEEILSVFEAVSQAYPMIVSANLTKNTYTMIKDDVFLARDLPARGRFDDLIDFGVEFIHPNYQSVFFQRETITTVWTGKARGICQALSKGAW